MYTRYLAIITLVQYKAAVGEIEHDHTDNVIYNVQGILPHFCVHASTATVEELQRKFLQYRDSSCLMICRIFRDLHVLWSVDRLTTCAAGVFVKQGLHQDDARV